jgi:hypothetical protein
VPSIRTKGDAALQASKLRARGVLTTVKRNPRLSLLIGAFLTIVTATYFVAPYSEICKTAKDSSQINCPLYRAPLAVLIAIADFLRTNAEPIIAVATAALFVATYRLWRATVELAADTNKDATKQAELTREAIRLSEKQFIASNRPRLAVRQIFFNDPDGDGGPANPSVIYFTVFNKGASPAKITRIETTDRLCDKGSRLPGVLPFSDDRQMGADPRVIPTGGSWFTEYPIDDAYRMRILRVPRSILKSKDFFLFGRITYEDKNGVVRKFGFCRRYDPDSDRFERAGDSDYEYSD